MSTHPSPRGSAHDPLAGGPADETPSLFPGAQPRVSRRVLSLWQPWASLCVVRDPEREDAPPKAFETRHWRPRAHMALPIPVVIHAAATRRPEMRAALADPTFRDTLRRCGADPDALPFGAIVGVATVVAVHEAGALARRLATRGRATDHRELAFGGYEAGRYAWRLADARPLPAPIAFKGRQDPLYIIPPDVGAAVDAQLAAGVARAA